MSLLQFLNNTCDVIEKQITMSWWEQTITDNTIYSDISCYYFTSTTNISNTTESSLNTQLDRTRVIVEPNKTDIKKGYHIIIKDPDLWEVWEYIIESIKMNRLANGTNDSLECKVKAVW